MCEQKHRVAKCMQTFNHYTSVSAEEDDVLTVSAPLGGLSTSFLEPGCRDCSYKATKVLVSP